MNKLLEQIHIEKKPFRLGDLVKINERSLMSNITYSEIEYIDTASVTENCFNKPEVLDTKNAPSRAKRLVKDGDTIISTVRPNLKHYGYIKKPKENTVVSTGFAVLTPKLIDPFYLFSYLTKDSVTNTLTAIAEATTTTFPAFRPEILADLEIIVPDLPTQKKIADILSAYDAKIENNNLIIKKLEETAQSLFNEWFVNFHFPGYEKIKFVDSELGEIPEGWKVDNVERICDRLPSGKTYREDELFQVGSVPVYDQSSKGTIGFHNENSAFTANPENPILIFGDHTCRFQLVCEPFSLGPNTIPLAGRDGYNPIYSYFLIKELIDQREYKRHWNELLSHRLIIPPTYLVDKWIRLVSPMISSVVFFENEILSLKSQRDLLLAKLI